jgi:hypothetical protein
LEVVLGRVIDVDFESVVGAARRQQSGCHHPSDQQCGRTSRRPTSPTSSDRFPHQASSPARTPRCRAPGRRRDAGRRPASKHPDVLVVGRRVGEHPARLVHDNLFPTITARNRHQ